jgi:plasmid maintenance system antidote protein VapI
MEKQEGSSNKSLTNAQIAGEMLAQIAVFSIDSIIAEDTQIDADLAIIDAAIVAHGIDSWMSIRSVTNILTDKTEVDKFINEVPSENRFYKNYVEVAALVTALNRWVKEDLVGSQDSVVKVFNVLVERRAENLVMLGESPD